MTTRSQLNELIRKHVFVKTHLDCTCPLCGTAYRPFERQHAICPACFSRLRRQGLSYHERALLVLEQKGIAVP